MAVTTLTSIEFSQDVSKAKCAAEKGPVIITDRGQPSHVLMTYEEFERLTRKCRNLAETLSMPGLSSIGYETPRVELTTRDVDFS